MNSNEIKKMIEKLDNKLDDERISNEEFNSISLQIRDLYIELAKQERIENDSKIKVLNDVNDWYKTFLKSFKIGTRKITNRQAECFKKLGYTEFVYDGLVYSCSGPNYRTGFSMVVVREMYK